VVVVVVVVVVLGSWVSRQQPLAQAWARYFTVCTKFVQTVNEEHRFVMAIRLV